MDENAVRRAVTRITYEILERNKGADNLFIVGIFSRGAVLAERIAKKISELEKTEVLFTGLDITPYICSSFVIGFSRIMNQSI